MKRRTLLQHTSALTLLGLLTACGGGNDNDNPPQPGTQAKTTLLVYLVASDLLDGRGAERDLINMLKAQNHSEVNVVLQIGGGASPGEYPGIDMQQTRRYRLVPQAGSREGWTLQELPASEQPGQIAMNLPSTLRDFIAWGARTYPAQQYALSLWNHGGGPIHGFGSDDATGGGTMLSLPQIKTALQQAGVTFELIGFDCCLMASLEVTQALAPHTRYLVASEEVTFGWEWSKVVGHLAAQPSSPGDSFGRAIIDSYKAFYSSTPLDFTAYSLSDSRRLEPVMQVLGRIAQSLTSTLSERGLQAWWALALARREALDFQSNMFQRNMDLVDVKDWVHELGRVDIIPAGLIAEFDAAFKALVVYTDGGEDEASGLMMYFPRYSTLDTRLQEKYHQLNFLPAYHELVRAYSSFAASKEMPYIEVGAPRRMAAQVVADVQLIARPESKKALPELKRAFDMGYGLLVLNGVAVGLQAAQAQERQVVLPTPQLWPQVQGQTLCLLLEDEEENDYFQIPAVSEEQGPGVLITSRNEQGALQINWFVSVDQLAGSSAAMLEIRPGSRYLPMHLRVSDGQWVESAQQPIQAPADGSPWLLSFAAPAASSTAAIHMMATDLTGELRISAQGIALA